MTRLAVRYAMVALLFFGSATLLFSCDSQQSVSSTSDESIMTDFSENLSVVQSRNGRRSYLFTSPLVEGYALAREPYREFRKGVDVTTYQDDSLQNIDSRLTANYAIYYERKELWEAKGNVVVEKSDGKTLYTQQLFWNARTKKIYSNVDSKIVQSGGRDVFIGEGFESDEEFRDWRFRRMKGRMEVDVAPTDQVDSAASGPIEPTASAPTSSLMGDGTHPGLKNKSNADTNPNKQTSVAPSLRRRSDPGSMTGPILSVPVEIEQVPIEQKAVSVEQSTDQGVVLRTNAQEQSELTDSPK